MPDIDDGDTVEVEGSSSTYTLENKGGVYSCTCPAWRHQSLPIDRRTCKHLRAYRGEEAEAARIGGENMRPVRAKAPPKGSSEEDEGDSAKAPPVLLAHKWDNETDITGWWMSEKLDGVRAYWDGQQFVSRQGNVFVAPEWFVEGLPSDPLDGELWIDRGQFQKTVSIVRRIDAGRAWEQIRYLIFDAPHLKDPFEARMDYVQAFIDDVSPDFAMPVKQERCDGYDHLRTELERVEQLGGEGLMLRQPGSKYVKGRSTTLLKVKSFHDSEAVVIDHLPGTGRHKGRLGALRVELKDGTAFSVGTGFSDAEREDPPEIGSVITFRYQELTDGGVPRFPSFVGVRADLSWDQADGTLAKEAPPTPARHAPPKRPKR
jgi:DNA ligase-1